MFTNHDINSGDDKSFDYLTKPYLGTIMDPNDPLYEGRCKIMVHGVYDGLSTDDLPWANPATKSTYFGKNGSASISIPKKDALVVVYFNHGDIYSPEYFQVQELAPDLQSQLKADTGDYLNSHYIMWDGDVELKIYFTKKTGMMIDYQNSQINIKPDKSIIIQNASRKGIVEMLDDGKMNITQASDITIKCKAKIDATADTSVTVHSPKVIIDHTNTIELGQGATEKVILGNKFMALFNSHTHIGNLGVPTSPPITPMTPGELSQMKVVVK